MGAPGIRREAIGTLDALARLVEARGYASARALARSLVAKCRELHEQIAPGEAPSTRDEVLVYGILFRGFENLMELVEITEARGWQEEHERVEEAWEALCDAKDRIEHVATMSTIDHKALAWARDRLGLIDRAFARRFGPGLYASPEFLIRRSHCSVCGKDPRTCDHIPGELHDGVLCQVVIDELGAGHAVALVKEPADPRCRIWPWNTGMRDGVLHGEMCFLTSYSVDDFLDEPAPRAADI